MSQLDLIFYFIKKIIKKLKLQKFNAPERTNQIPWINLNLKILHCCHTWQKIRKKQKYELQKYIISVVIIGMSKQVKFCIFRVFFAFNFFLSDHNDLNQRFEWVQCKKNLFEMFMCKYQCQ